ncbi:MULTISPECIES: histidine phosphatase family protein [unclassified Frigoribacterium]|uniref:histidine phosphatase family protein n=1 Tax=unclassified Frigoribacterium TaxID=2627005 RepID=UPI0006FA1621|nr:MULTISPECIES: histidine phosphatase family protein [unclassified Frigoribacterium]KQM26191.1 histidine phosphatase [Frigoribacterium sp. Leaf8]WAC51237.1 histidine phosphatase family protein [Frigoribacterium sp. SL97]
MRLLLIRHGQTPDNVEGVLGTVAPGVGLTDLGRRQAEALPAALADETIGALLVSTLVRTQLTAAPLAAARGLAPTVLDGLREVKAGDLEGRHDIEAVTAYVGCVFSWASGDLDVRVPGSEDGHEFYARYDAALADLIAGAEGDGHETVAAVSHGAAIRAWVGSRAVNADDEFIRQHLLENTGVVTLEGSIEAGWRLQTWQGLPVGGAELLDLEAADPTGESY